jgi:DNA-binding transcriptional ArsR family regulator
MTCAMTPLTTTATLSRLFRVLADPTRLALVQLLEDGELPVRQLVEAVGASQPRVSTHLAWLRHCGVVATEWRGREVIDRLSIPGSRTCCGWPPTSRHRAEHLATCRRVGPDWI